MDLTAWNYLFRFGNGLYIHAKGRERVGVDEDGNVVVAYKIGPDKSPRCQECLEKQSTSSNLT